MWFIDLDIQEDRFQELILSNCLSNSLKLTYMFMIIRERESKHKMADNNPTTQMII